MEIKRELIPGVTITITLTDDEVEQTFREQELSFRVEDALEHIDRIIAQYSNEDDEDDTSGFEQRYGFPPHEVEGNKAFAKDCALAFMDKSDCNFDENSIWDNVMDEHLKFFGQCYAAAAQE